MTTPTLAWTEIMWPSTSKGRSRTALTAAARSVASAVLAHGMRQDRELVAVDPRHDRVAAHLADETATDLDQQLVAQVQAVGLVDVAQSVDVDEDQRDRGVVR